MGPPAAANTTLGVVATNAVLSKGDVRRLATVGNDAFDVAIRPAHTIYDGDTVFALATQQIEASFEQVATLVEPAITTSIRRAVTGSDRSGAAGS
jgi:L-aminopeptidase/D-esterase-like protein